ncbi:hypothetical protein THRCLA_08477 [Thraustotheca clavata]|uniref:Uncharacterized protein n=1 Tax=Thraustotheca clavata TaxID=74557 RepID=A0A1V9Z5Q1_9STRA|nr:hypothetical protein THRCLA_08477 [Thraustotheca clavata]
MMQSFPIDPKLSFDFDENIDTELLSEYFFSSTKTTQNESPTHSRKARDRRHRAKVKNELENLRETAYALTEKLTMLQTNRDFQDIVCASSWKMRARRQAAQLKKAVQENHKLREAVHDQIHIAQTFQRIVTKRSRNPETQDEKNFNFYSLKYATSRKEYCIELVEKELTKLNSTLLRFGLLDGLKDCNHIAMDAASGALEIVDSHAIPTPAPKAIEALWKIVSGNQHTSEYQCLEFIDSHTSYVRYSSDLPNKEIHFESHYVIKRLDDKNKTIFVWRSVLEDDKYPHSTTSLLDNSSGWYYCYFIQVYLSNIVGLQLSPKTPLHVK